MFLAVKVLTFFLSLLIFITFSPKLAQAQQTGSCISPGGSCTGGGAPCCNQAFVGYVCSSTSGGVCVENSSATPAGSTGCRPNGQSCSLGACCSNTCVGGLCQNPPPPPNNTVAPLTPSTLANFNAAPTCGQPGFYGLRADLSWQFFNPQPVGFILFRRVQLPNGSWGQWYALTGCFYGTNTFRDYYVYGGVGLQYQYQINAYGSYNCQTQPTNTYRPTTNPMMPIVNPNNLPDNCWPVTDLTVDGQKSGYDGTFYWTNYSSTPLLSWTTRWANSCRAETGPWCPPPYPNYNCGRNASGSERTTALTNNTGFGLMCTNVKNEGGPDAVNIKVGPEPFTTSATAGCSGTSQQVALSWKNLAGFTPIANTDRFIVNRNGSYVTTTTGYSYTDTGLSPSSTYTYQVIAERGTPSNGDGKAQPSSNTPSVVTPNCSPPDLKAAAGTTIPANPRVGMRVSFNGTVTNNGIGSAGPSRTRLEIRKGNTGNFSNCVTNTDSTQSCIDNTVRDQSTPGIAAGSNRSVGWSNAWTPTEADNYEFRIVADILGEVAETNEGADNISNIVPFTVEGALPAWIQTTSGDVHSNGNINIPGGP